MVAVDEFGKCHTCGPLVPEGRRTLKSLSDEHLRMGHATVLWSIPRSGDAAVAEEAPAEH